MELHYIFCVLYSQYSSSVRTVFSRVFGQYRAERLADCINQIPDYQLVYYSVYFHDKGICLYRSNYIMSVKDS